MMDPIEFLCWVVPSGNNYSVFKGENDKKKTFWSQKSFTDKTQLYNYVKMLDERHARETYFALASFVHATVETTRGGVTKKVPQRTQNNVAALRSFWVDIDCKGIAGTYNDKREALQAVSEVVDKGVVPKPSIVVDSGNGIHVYWCLDEDIHPADWEPVALGFRNALVRAGLRIDEGITVDSARILRVPGTHNHKDPKNPKPVRILGHYERHKWDAFAPFAEQADASIASYHDALLGPNLEGVEFDPDEFGDLGEAASSEPFQMEHIVEECPQMAAMLKSAGADVPEPLWKSMLLVAAKCTDGLKYAHRLSKGHPDYTPEDTEAKFDRQVATIQAGRAGPTRCATFSAARPDLCSGCPHNGAIKSPLLLGRANGSLPPGYRTVASGIERHVYDEEDGWTWQLVCTTFIDTLSLFYDPDRGQVLVGEYRAGQFSGQFSLDYSVITQPASRAIPHINKAGLMIRPSEIAGFLALMVDWSTYLSRRRSGTAPSRIIGWTSDLSVFTLRERHFSDRGEHRGLYLDEGRLKGYSPVGSRKAWDTAAPYILQAPIELQLMVLLSFAAPLVAFTGMDGFIFSFRSGGSGTGKTTSLRAGASIWGDPINTTFHMADTPKSVLRRIGLAPHLPAYWDEVRVTGAGQDFAMLGKVLFEIAQGREMSRLRADISFNTSGNWKTMLGVATNDSLVDLASNTHTGPEPILARLLELELPPSDLQPVGAASDALKALEKNYGHIGAEYLAYIVPRRAEIRTAINKVADRLQHAGIGGVQRYWQLAAGCMVVAAALANASGLLKVNQQAVYRRMQEALATQREVYADTMTELDDALSTFREWFLCSQDYWLITEDAFSPNASRTAQPLTDPRRGMLFHCDMKSGRVLLRVSSLSEWCRDHKRPPIVFRRKLLPIVDKRLATIGAGTAFSDKQGNCLSFDMDALGVREAVERQIERSKILWL